jgi:hypothetical protein
MGLGNYWAATFSVWLVEARISVDLVSVSIRGARLVHEISEPAAVPSLSGNAVVWMTRLTVPDRSRCRRMMIHRSVLVLHPGNNDNHLDPWRHPDVYLVRKGLRVLLDQGNRWIQG